MSLLADQIIEWSALWQVIYISAIAGIGIALVLGVGIVASLRAQDVRSEGGSSGGALALHGVTVISVILVAAAIVVGITYMVNK